MRSDLPFCDMPLVDHHCHSWLRDWQTQDAVAFRSCFTESSSARVARDHVCSSLPYRRALTQLGGLLECPPTEESILEIRRSMPAQTYLERLFSGAGIGVMFLDDGFPPAEDALSRQEIARLTGIRTERVIRLETLVERLTLECETFGEVVDRFDMEVGDIRRSQAAGLKSIAAYRSGLRVGPVSGDVAEAEWRHLRERVEGNPPVRLDGKPLVDFFALRGLMHASRQGIPFQIHCGYGDADLDLREANPLHLRPVLEDEVFRGASIILLHGAYPFTAEGAYLAAVYPHVYLDVSTALPPLGMAALTGMLSVAFSVTPAGKLLLSTDAACIPEHHVLGERAARLALRDALDQAVRGGDLRAAEVDEIAAWPLSRTARSIYTV
jgi:uncharacterized protein